MKRSLIWLWMFQKRMFYHVGFIILLALIPTLVLIMSVFARRDSSVLTVGLLTQSPADPVATEIVDTLMRDKTVVRYRQYDSETKMRADMESNRLDAAWIFPSDLQQQIKRYGSGKTNVKLATVWESDSDILLNLSHERLYGAMFPYVSYAIYEHYVRDGLLDESQADDATLKKYYSYYSENVFEGQLVRTKYSGGGELRRENYLLIPMRGLLGILVLLCGFAGMMYHLQDSRSGVYDWLPARKRLMPAVANILVAVFDAIAAMAVALAFAGLVHNWKEIPALLLFGLCGTAFCLLVGQICRRETVLAAIVPIVLLMMLAICPVFFNVKALAFLRPFCPLYYYLYGVSDLLVWLFAVGFSAAAGVCVWAAERFRNRYL